MENSNAYIKAAIISVFLSFPFISIASYFVLTAKSRGGWGELGSVIAGVYIYVLGLPLTFLTYFVFPNEKLSHGTNKLLPVLVTNILFIIQWVTWSQIIVLIFNKFGLIK